MPIAPTHGAAPRPRLAQRAPYESGRADVQPARRLRRDGDPDDLARRDLQTHVLESGAFRIRARGDALHRENRSRVACGDRGRGGFVFGAKAFLRLRADDRRRETPRVGGACGGPSTSRPPRRTVTVSATPSTSRILWRIGMIVTPVALRLFRRPNNVSIPVGESTAVGSSRMSTLASATRARAWMAGT